MASIVELRTTHENALNEQKKMRAAAVERQRAHDLLARKEQQEREQERCKSTDDHR